MPFETRFANSGGAAPQPRLVDMTPAEFDRYLMETTGATENHLRWSKLEPEQAETERQIVPELAATYHNNWRNSYQNPQVIDGVTLYTPHVQIEVIFGDPASGDQRTDWFSEVEWNTRDEPGSRIPADAQEFSRQDIANTDFAELHPHWQKDNLAAAIDAIHLVWNAIKSGVVHDLDSIDLDDPQQRIYFGQGTHHNWLRRNPWELEGPRRGDFTELTPVDQEKDLDQIRATLKALRRG